MTERYRTLLNFFGRLRLLCWNGITKVIVYLNDSYIHNHNKNLCAILVLFFSLYLEVSEKSCASAICRQLRLLMQTVIAFKKLWFLKQAHRTQKLPPSCYSRKVFSTACQINRHMFSDFLLIFTARSVIHLLERIWDVQYILIMIPPLPSHPRSIPLPCPF